jgi:CheY-like chemotaxis protein
MPKVLIVEDDPILRDAFATVLKAEQHEVMAASDGVEGLELAAQQLPEVILLDMLMPTLNGLEFLRSLDAPANHPRAQIIVFSNMSVPSDVKQALELGATKYLTKSSFTPKEIAAIIKDVLNKQERA